MCWCRCCVQVRFLCCNDEYGKNMNDNDTGTCANYGFVTFTLCFMLDFCQPEVKLPVNLCKPNPCMNDGICILSGGSFQCQCQGYDGPHCERSQWRYWLLLYCFSSLLSHLSFLFSSCLRCFHRKRVFFSTHLVKTGRF